MNRRDFIKAFGVTALVATLPLKIAKAAIENNLNGAAFDEPIPGALPALKDYSALHQLVAFHAIGTALESEWAEIIIRRKSSSIPLIAHRINAYGGILHHEFRCDPIYEIAGFEIEIVSESRHVQWYAKFIDVNGLASITAGDGSETIESTPLSLISF